MAAKGGSHKIGRNASSGRFVPVKSAQQDPKHNVVEKIPNPKKK